MKIDFEDLKKEFDAFNVSCEDNECEEDVSEEGFIEIVQKYMLTPAICGVYFSRLDIKVIGLRFGEDVQIRERKRMLRDILKAVVSKKEMERLFDIIKNSADEKRDIYKELVEKFPHTKDIFEENFEKIEKFKNRLDEILKEVSEEI